MVAVLVLCVLSTYTDILLNSYSADIEVTGNCKEMNIDNKGEECGK